MGVTRQVLQEGNGIDYPQPGDEVKIHYVGTLESDGKQYARRSFRSLPSVLLTVAILGSIHPGIGAIPSGRRSARAESSKVAMSRSFIVTRLSTDAAKDGTKESPR